jgi:hypothetical protein
MVLQAKELTRRKAIHDLGQRAIDYYIDTGLCVFCDADDCEGIPHEDCNVGELAGVELNEERIAKKKKERALVDNYILQRAKNDW